MDKLVGEPIGKFIKIDQSKMKEEKEAPDGGGVVWTLLLSIDTKCPFVELTPILGAILKDKWKVTPLYNVPRTG